MTGFDMPAAGILCLELAISAKANVRAANVTPELKQAAFSGARL
jgi:hypothetical protein